MITKLIREIDFGNYQMALDLLETREVCDVLKLSLSSRISELNGRFDKAYSLAEQAIDIYDHDVIDKHNDSNISELAFAFAAKAYAQWRLLNFADGKKSVLVGLKLISDNPMDGSISARYVNAVLVNVLGLINWKQDKLLNSLLLFDFGLALRKVEKNQVGIGYSLNNIGNTFLKLSDFNATKKYYSQSLKIREKIGAIPGIAASMNSFGRLFDEFGEFDLALKYHLKSLELWQQVKNIQFVAKSYRFLGSHFLKQGDKDQSINYFEKSLNLFNSLNNTVDADVTKQILNKY